MRQNVFWGSRTRPMMITLGMKMWAWDTGRAAGEGWRIISSRDMISQTTDDQRAEWWHQSSGSRSPVESSVDGQRARLNRWKVDVVSVSLFTQIMHKHVDIAKNNIQSSWEVMIVFKINWCERIFRYCPLIQDLQSFKCFVLKLGHRQLYITSGLKSTHQFEKAQQYSWKQVDEWARVHQHSFIDFILLWWELNIWLDQCLAKFHLDHMWVPLGMFTTHPIPLPSLSTLGWWLLLLPKVLDNEMGPPHVYSIYQYIIPATPSSPPAPTLLRMLLWVIALQTYAKLLTCWSW